MLPHAVLSSKFSEGSRRAFVFNQGRSPSDYRFNLLWLVGIRRRFWEIAGALITIVPAKKSNESKSFMMPSLPVEVCFTKSVRRERLLCLR